MELTWHLVKNNEAGQGIFMIDLGEGVSVSLEIPEDPSTYTLYLTGAKEEDVVTDQSALNTPLF
jgi:hypothetical protein